MSLDVNSAGAVGDASRCRIGARAAICTRTGVSAYLLNGAVVGSRIRTQRSAGMPRTTSHVVRAGPTRISASRFPRDHPALASPGLTPGAASRPPAGPAAGARSRTGRNRNPRTGAGRTRESALAAKSRSAERIPRDLHLALTEASTRTTRVAPTSVRSCRAGPGSLRQRSLPTRRGPGTPPRRSRGRSPPPCPFRVAPPRVDAATSPHSELVTRDEPGVPTAGRPPSDHPVTSESPGRIRPIVLIAAAASPRAVDARRSRFGSFQSSSIYIFIYTHSPLGS